MVDEVTDESVCCFEKWICVILNHYTGFVKIYYANDCAFVFLVGNFGKTRSIDLLKVRCAKFKKGKPEGHRRSPSSSPSPRLGPPRVSREIGGCAKRPF